MKILNITDLHLTQQRFSGRKGDFISQQLNKLNEIGTIINSEKIDRVLINGDLFDKPRVSNVFLVKVVGEMIKWKIPIDITPGNHDLYNDNIKTLNRTSLGIFNLFGLINILTEDNPKYYKIGSKEIAIQGKEYKIDLENQESTYQYTGKDVDFSILSVHGMLMDNEAPFDHFTLVKDVETNANILTTGHYHPGFKNIITETSAIVNPKALIRKQRTKSNYERIPGGLIFTIDEVDDKIEFKIKEFSLKTSFLPFDEVFKVGEFEEYKEENSKFEAFTDNLEKIEIQEDISPEEILRLIAKQENISADIIKKTLESITGEEEKEQNYHLEDYVESEYRVWITKLEIQNFMSHTNTTLEFDKGLNAIIGLSGAGKTAILNALLLVLYNVPSGKSFIRTGEKETVVRATFSNNKRITRTVKLNSTGTYLVEDLKTGTKDEYKHFKDLVPIEVTNAHQMPKMNLFGKGLEDVCISRQLKPHFLIADSGANVALALGVLSGTQKIDTTISLKSKELINISKEISTSKINIENFNKEIEKMINIKDFEKNIEILKSYIIDYEKIESKISVLKSLVEKEQKIKLEINKIKLEIKDIPNLELLTNKLLSTTIDVNKIIELYDLYKNKHFSVLNYKKISKELKDIPNLILLIKHNEELSKNIIDLENKNSLNIKESINKKNVTLLKNNIKTIPNLALLQKKNIIQEDRMKKIITLNKLNIDIKLIKNTIKLNKEKLNKIPNLKSLDTKVDENTTNINKYIELIKLNSLIIDMKSNMSNHKTNMKTLTNEIEENANKFKLNDEKMFEIIKELNICPTCGVKHLSEEQINNIKEKVGN